MGLSLSIGFGLGIILLMSIIATLVSVRRRQYKYNPKQDYQYLFDKAYKSEEIKNNSFIDLSGFSDQSTLILEIKIKSNLLGYFFQPFIVTDTNSAKRESHYFEHGLNGVRYLDISRFRGSKITLKPNNCSLPNDTWSLYSFKNMNISEKKILILAPHADDAEIAAYGLYSNSQNAHIITVTVGEEGKCDYCGLYGTKIERARLKGKLRVIDALSVAMLGNVPYERCAMLGYYGKSLKWMHDNPEKKATSTISDIDDIHYFREVKHTTFVNDSKVDATWKSLVNDLSDAIVGLSPDTIITPHPEIDSHSDHQYTTYALLEAMERCQMRTIPLYCYTNHHVYTEAYPYGPMFSTSALAPKFRTPFSCFSIHSNTLDEQAQIEKFYALESMHDLRDATLVIGVKKAWKHFIKQLKRAIYQRDKSYYRRSVRPNELFYLTDWETLNNLSK